MKPLQEEFGWFRADISMAYIAHKHRGSIPPGAFWHQPKSANPNQQVVADHSKR